MAAADVSAAQRCFPGRVGRPDRGCAVVRSRMVLVRPLVAAARSFGWVGRPISGCWFMISRNPQAPVFKESSERPSLDDGFGPEFSANLVGCAFRSH